MKPTEALDTAHAMRYRAARWSVLANFASKGLLALTALLAVSQTVGYLGTERFAGWMLILGLATLLMFLDLGLGNALSNRVSALAVSRAQAPQELAAAISHGLFLVLLVACVMGALLALTAWFAPWQAILKITTPTVLAEVREAAVMLSLCFTLQVVSNALQRVYAGLQRAYVAHAFVAAGALVAVLLLIWAAAQQASIGLLLLSCAAPPTLCSFGLVFMLRREGLTVPELSTAGLQREARVLYKPAALFLLLQFGALAAASADGLIVSATLGAQALAVYAVGQRLFQFVAQPFAIANTPLWAAYADAHHRGDKAFIARTLKLSMLCSLGGALAAVALVLAFREPLVALWTGGKLQLPVGLAIALAAWCVLEITGGAFAMFLNGCNVIGPQVVIVSVFVVLALAFKVFAALNFGLMAVPIAGAALYLLVTVGLYSTVYRKTVFSRFQSPV